MNPWYEDEELRELVASTRLPCLKSADPERPTIFESPPSIPDPVWVSAEGDTGDRATTARRTGDWIGLGVDAVAGAVNELWARGAMPATVHATLLMADPDPAVREQLVSGIASGCRADGVAIMGLHTKHLGTSTGGHDLCLLALGAGSRSTILDGSRVQRGDLLVGLGGHGLHSQGHATAWSISDAQPWARRDEVPGTGAMLETLIGARHKTYLGTLQRPVSEQWVHALVPVARGGLIGSLERWLPPPLTFRLDLKAWDLPPFQRALERAAGMSREQMLRGFNGGIGMVAVMPAERVPQMLEWIRLWNETVWVIGAVES